MRQPGGLSTQQNSGDARGVMAARHGPVTQRRLGSVERRAQLGSPVCVGTPAQLLKYCKAKAVISAVLSAFRLVVGLFWADRGSSDGGGGTCALLTETSRQEKAWSVWLGECVPQSVSSVSSDLCINNQGY